MAITTRNVFISHIHEDDARLKDLKQLLRGKGMNVRDSSVYSSCLNKAKNVDYIKQLLGRRIQWAGTVLVLMSPETCKHPWVDWEIERAEREGKRIVGVWCCGDADCKVPDALDKYGDAVVGWDGQRVIDAIEGRINNWQKEDGSPFPQRNMPRYTCG